MARILTETDILNARTYIPIDKKAELARNIALMCVDRVEVSLKDSGKGITLPPRVQENPRSKMLYGMQVLLGMYLKKTDMESDFLVKEYDEWCEAAILNQLDRMKMNKSVAQDVRNRVYDLVDDYREFYRMLGTEISSIVEAQNDPVARVVAFLSKAVTPEALKGAAEAFKESYEEMSQYMKEREKTK